MAKSTPKKALWGPWDMGKPAKERFARAAKIASHVLSDQALNAWSWRIESDLLFFSKNGKSVYDMPFKDLQAMRRRDKAGKKIRVDFIPVKKRPSRS